MTRRILQGFLLMYLLPVWLFSVSNPSSPKIFYVIKSLFPETQKVYVLIDQNSLPGEKENIARAAAQNKFKVTIFPVDLAADISKALREIPENSVVVVYNSEIFSNKSSKLFILKKSKEKKLALVACTEDYSRSGALVGIIPQASGKTKIVVNLKHSPAYQSKFTSDLVQQTGIAEVIR